DGYINLAIVCWKRTRETPNPYPEGYGLDHFGVQVDDLDRAEERARGAGATPQPPPPVDLAKLGGRLFFEKKLQTAGGKCDLSGQGWPVKPEKERSRLPASARPTRRTGCRSRCSRSSASRRARASSSPSSGRAAAGRARSCTSWAASFPPKPAASR